MKCPECGGAMWDNREDKRNPKSPDYKCKDKSCGHAVWLNDKKDEPKKGPFSELADEQNAVEQNFVNAAKASTILDGLVPIMQACIAVTNGLVKSLNAEERDLLGDPQAIAISLFIETNRKLGKGQ